MLTKKPSLASLPSSTTLPSSAKMPPSSATLPSWENCCLGQTHFPRQSCCPRKIHLLAKLSCKLAILGKVANGVIASIPLALMQALGCPHRGHCPGVVAIVAIVALVSLRRWHHHERHPGAAWALLLSRCWCHCRRCPGTIAIVAIVALASLRRWHHCRRCPGGLAPPPSRASMPTSWSLAFLPSSQRNRRLSGPVPLRCPLFQVDLSNCLGFGPRRDSRAARLLGRRCPSLCLCLLG
jgi:hypothetical protein